jgi:hypothetical protein
MNRFIDTINWHNVENEWSELLFRDSDAGLETDYPEFWSIFLSSFMQI